MCTCYAYNDDEREGVGGLDMKEFGGPGRAGPRRQLASAFPQTHITTPPRMERQVHSTENGEFGNSCYASGASLFTAVAKVLRIAMNQLGIQLFSPVIGS